MMRRSAGWGSAAAGLAALLAVAVGAGCGPGPSLRTVLDLAGAIDDAAVVREPAVIDFGVDEARPHLGRGWHHDERARSSGDTFVWSRGRESEIVFHLGWTRDLEAELIVRPFQFPGAEAQTVAFELNGREIGDSLTLNPARQRTRLVLPAAAQVVGRNLLVVRYGRVHRPAEVDPATDDERELAVAWSEMRLDPVDATEIHVDGGDLRLPAGCRVDHFVAPGPKGELRIDGCDSLGSRTAEVEISLLSEGGGSAVEILSCGKSGGGVSLGLDGEDLTRIRLQVRPVEEGDGAPPNGAVILQPRVVSAAASVATEGERTIPAPEIPRPNVIVYLVDALRADRLGPYGCDRGLSPNLDEVAAQGVTFTDMTAQSSWTKAAVASIFTGVWPRVHGVNGPDDRLPDDRTTLPEHLQRAGYRTGAVVANAYVGRPFGFARGFDHFEFLELGRSRSEVVGDRVEAWLEAVGDSDDPFFLYVHTIDPHAPYAPPERFRDAFASEVEDPSIGRVEVVRGLVLGTVQPTPELGRDLRDLYDAEVAANDASFGRLVRRLDAMGELDRTLLIFTSDHGEAFGEHDTWTHGLDLHDEVLSVPLVVRLPGAADAGRRITSPVQHIDLLPTILRRCGVDGGESLPGSPLLAGDKGTETGSDRPVFAYLDYWGKHGATVIQSDWKLIEPLSADFGRSSKLYRRDRDGHEERNLFDESPVRAGWLGARLGVALRHRGESRAIEVSPEVKEQLEALGYMH